jgi:hypothetical protein
MRAQTVYVTRDIEHGDKTLHVEFEIIGYWVDLSEGETPEFGWDIEPGRDSTKFSIEENLTIPIWMNEHWDELVSAFTERYNEDIPDENDIPFL